MKATLLAVTSKRLWTLDQPIARSVVERKTHLPIAALEIKYTIFENSSETYSVPALADFSIWLQIPDPF